MLSIGAASVNDAIAWILLIVAISLTNVANVAGAGWVCLAVTIYATLLFTVGRLAFQRLVISLEGPYNVHDDEKTQATSANRRHSLDSVQTNVVGEIPGSNLFDSNSESKRLVQNMNSLFCFSLMLLFLSAWVTSMMGLDGIIGSFIFGVIVPRQSLLHGICVRWLEEVSLSSHTSIQTICYPHSNH